MLLTTAVKAEEQPNIALNIYKTTVVSKHNPERLDKWFEIYEYIKQNDCGKAIASVNVNFMRSAHIFWKSHMIETGTCFQKDQKQAASIVATWAANGSFIPQIRYAYYMDNSIGVNATEEEVILAYFKGLASMLPFRRVASRTEHFTKNVNYIFSGNQPSSRYKTAAKELQNLIDRGPVGYIRIAEILLTEKNKPYSLRGAIRWLDKVMEKGNEHADFLFIDSLLEVTDENHITYYRKKEAIEKLHKLKGHNLTAPQQQKLKEWQKIY